MGTVNETPTWPEIEAYFAALGFQVRPENIGSMMRRGKAISMLQFERQYIARGGLGWRCELENAVGRVTFIGPYFDDPISAYVNAEIENWGRP